MAANCCKNHRRRFVGESPLLPSLLKMGQAEPGRIRSALFVNFFSTDHTALSISRPWPYVVEDAALKDGENLSLYIENH
ncbi:hypothetical protein AOLI_G00036860 [Acnodon oligacanthus]